MKVGVLFKTNDSEFVKRVIEKTAEAIGSKLDFVPCVSGFIIFVDREFGSWSQAKDPAGQLVATLERDPGGRREILIDSGSGYQTLADHVVKIEEENARMKKIIADLPISEIVGLGDLLSFLEAVRKQGASRDGVDHQPSART